MARLAAWMLMMLILAACGKNDTQKKASEAATGHFDLSKWAREQRQALAQRHPEMRSQISFERKEATQDWTKRKVEEKLQTLLDFLEAYDVSRPKVADRYQRSTNRVNIHGQAYHAVRYVLRPGSEGRVNHLHLYFEHKDSEQPSLLYAVQREANYLYELQRRSSLQLDGRGSVRQARIRGFQKILWFDIDSFAFQFQIRYP